MISIFTPTYNRGYILPELFHSLLKQTCQDFEWIIVDDGSTDKTSELIDVFIKKANFPIHYFYKKNEGKHIAINYGAEKAIGEWFFIVDSDDILPEKSVEIINKYCHAIKDDKRFAGIAGNRAYKSGKIIGNSVSSKYIDMTSANFRKKYIGDKAEVIKTDLIRQYKFPSFKNEKFMQESVLWLSISNDGYLIRWIKEIIYIGDYINDGLTKNGKILSKNSPLSKSYAENHIVGSKNIKLIERIKSCINYYRYGKYGGLTYKSMYKKSNSKFLSLFAIIIAISYSIKKK